MNRAALHRFVDSHRQVLSVASIAVAGLLGWAGPAIVAAAHGWLS